MARHKAPLYQRVIEESRKRNKVALVNLLKVKGFDICEDRESDVWIDYKKGFYGSVTSVAVNHKGYRYNGKEYGFVDLVGALGILGV